MFYTSVLLLLTQHTGTLPIDQIKEGMFLEAQHDIDPDLVWPVKVIENVGGRLLLRYEAAETAAGDFWLFYLHHRLHPIGWARSLDCDYRPPTGSFACFIFIIEKITKKRRQIKILTEEERKNKVKYI